MATGNVAPGGSRATNGRVPLWAPSSFRVSRNPYCARPPLEAAGRVYFAGGLGRQRGTIVVFLDAGDGIQHFLEFDDFRVVLKARGTGRLEMIDDRDERVSDLSDLIAVTADIGQDIPFDFRLR